MVIFNPDVPDVQPKDYTNVSRPISDVSADKSKGMLLSTIGETLEGATSLYDRTEKDYLSKKIHDKVYNLQDAFLNDLKDVRSMQITGVTPPGAEQPTADQQSL